jgi:hypothetical protein
MSDPNNRRDDLDNSDRDRDLSAGRPNETLGDKVDNALDGRDDPRKGPLDRMANSLDFDDPRDSPTGAMKNALDGHDDPNRGPVDRADNAIDRADDSIDRNLR